MISSSLTNPSFDPGCSQVSPLGLLIVQRLLQLGRRNALLFEQKFANTDWHRSDPDGGPRMPVAAPKGEMFWGGRGVRD